MNYFIADVTFVSIHFRKGGDRLVVGFTERKCNPIVFLMKSRRERDKKVKVRVCFVSACV